MDKNNGRHIGNSNSTSLVANSMLVSKIMDTSIFTPKYFYCFEGNVCNMAVTRKRPRRQRANVSFCFLYIAVSENYNVQNSPLGMCVCVCVCVLEGGVGGAVCSRPCEKYRKTCERHQYCFVSANNSILGTSGHEI